MENIFKNVDVIKVPAKRKIINQLPAVLHTQTLQNFFAGTLDHLFQPAITEKVAGYIGKKPTYYDLDKEFYIPEINQERKTYQFETTAVSKSEDGTINSAIFYSDLLKELSFQGASTSNQNRLFEQNYYSWCPPINLDMFINYSQYFWIEQGPEPTLVKANTDVANQIIGKAKPDDSDAVFGVNGSIKLTSGMRIILLDDVDTTLNGKTYAIEGVGKQIKLLEFNEDDTISTPWDLMQWDRFEWDLSIATQPSYFTMERGCSDGNPWSKHNFWYHRDVLVASGSTIFENISNQAKRPIICFERELELWNYGSRRRKAVDLLDSATASISDFENFRPPVEETWVLVSVDGQLRFLNENNNIPYQEQINALKLEYAEDPEKVQIIRNGTRILFTAIEDSSITQNKAFVVCFDNPVENLVQHPWDVRSWDAGYWEQNDITAITSYSEIIDGYLRFEPVEDGYNNSSDATFGDIVKVRYGDWQGKEFWFNGSEWVLSQEKQYTNQQPLFALYDAHPDENVGIPLNDPIRYPNSTFAGNPIFGYKLNADVRTNIDEYVEKQLVRNEWGEIYFENFLTTSSYDYTPSLYNTLPITGYYFWKIKGETDFYGNNWWETSKPSKQYIVDTYNFTSTVELAYKQSYIATENQTSFVLFSSAKPIANTRVIVNGISVNFTINNKDNTVILNNPVNEGDVVNIFLYNAPKTLLEVDISQTPNLSDDNNIIVEIDGKHATKGEHYCLINQIEFNTNTPMLKLAILKSVNTNNPSVVKGMSIEIRTWSDESIDINNVPGYYEIPKNLELNADWGEVSYTTADQYMEHFIGIIGSQANLAGSPYDTNNWRDTLQDRSCGTKIIQHTAPLLRLMILNSDDDLNYIKASRYVEKEYNRFKNKFIQKLNKMWIRNIIINEQPEVVVDRILEELRLGKVYKEFPFSYSHMVAPGWFIPPTPSFLGLYPVYKPAKFIDTSYQNPIEVIIGHDGSIISAFQDGRDDILMNLEERIWNSIPSQYKDDPIPTFNFKNVIPGKFRNTDYNRTEILKVEKPMFERWVAENQQQYKQNSGFDYTNFWTYNYSSVEDYDGQALPGHWRGIYNWFFDTDRPHSHPWEMLGFSEKPSWWDDQYGPAPYTRGNTFLWNDLENGIIRHGSRAGTHSMWARPGLLSILPVDSVGNLVDPWTAGIISRKPVFNNAKQDWVFGDGSPIETIWRKTSQYAFAQTQLGYLLKPVLWIENCWNPLDNEYIYKNNGVGQLIHSSTRKRNQHSEFVVHGEVIDETSIQINSGYQCWITDRLLSNNKNPGVVFGPRIRGISAHLGYKVGGFCNKYTFYADNISGPLPAENIHQFLYKSPSIREETYSGVIIEWTGKTWKVYGYDVLSSSFSIIPGDKFGRVLSHSVGGTFISNPPAWHTSTNYKAGDFVEYNGLFYEAIINHMSGFDFNEKQWIRTTLKSQLAGVTVSEYCDPIYDNRIEQVPYGTEFGSRQEVFNFLIDYQRWLEFRGWVFEDIDPENNEQMDWRLYAKKFISWSLERDKPVGDFIKLSPYNKHAKYITSFGSIQSVEQIINGVYSMIDQDGFIIEPYETTVMRADDEININTVVDKQLFSVRLYVSEIEHVFLWDNITVFNDLIYDPIFGQRQIRLKAEGWRTQAWTGRLDAPGFLITSNTIVPNFEKTATEFLRLYNIENTSDNTQLFEQSTHLIGYQNRSYLQNMLVSSTTGLQFYQGMLHAKGSRGSMERLFRSEFVNESRDMNIHEEWAFRVGNYGATDTKPTLEFKLDALNKKQIKDDPQLIKFTSIDYNSSLPIEPSDLDDRYDSAITIYDYVNGDELITKDSRWLRRPGDVYDMWVTRNGSQKGDLPFAGPVKTNEIDFIAKNVNELLQLATTQRLENNHTMANGERVWVYDTGSGDWTILRVTATGTSGVIEDNGTSTKNTVETVSINTVFDQTVDCCTGVSNSITLVPNQLITLSADHGINPGQWFIVQGDIGTRIGQASEILGTYQAELGTHDSFLYYTTANQIENTWSSSDGPQIYSYSPVRFDTFGNSVYDLNNRIISMGVADSVPSGGWIAPITSYQTILDDTQFTTNTSGNWVGSIKLLNNTNVYGNTIKSLKFKVLENSNATDATITIRTEDKIYWSINQQHLSEQNLKTQFTLTDNLQNGSSNRAIVGTWGTDWFNGSYKIGSNVVGTIHSITMTIPVGHDFAYSSQGLHFSIGTAADPNLYVPDGSINMTISESITINGPFVLTKPQDIYVYMNIGSIPDQAGLMNVSINYDQEYTIEPNVVVTTDRDLYLTYDFGNATNVGILDLTIDIASDNHDMIWVDQPDENGWGVYTSSNLIANQTIVDLNNFGNHYTTSQLFSDNSSLYSKLITRVEVDISAWSSTSLTFNGGFDYSDYNNTSTHTYDNVQWQYNSLPVEGYTNGVDGYISDITISIQTSAEFVRPQLDIFRSNTTYATGDLICVNGLIYKANHDFTSGSSLVETDWDIMPLLQMCVGTKENPELIVSRQYVNLAIAGDIILTPNVIKVDDENIYVFFKFNDYNINNNSTSAVSITGIIKAYATISIPGTSWNEIVLVDELKNDISLYFTAKYNYIAANGNIRIGCSKYGNVGGLSVRVIAWDGNWNAIRREQQKIDPSQIESALIYNLDTERVERRLSYHDPFKGIVVGEALADINYKNIVDPAKYTHSTSINTADIDPEQSWGLDKVGMTWWDLSTTRVLDYEIENDLNYTWHNWGKFAPGTTVDVYEWVRSPVKPAELSTSETLNVSLFSGQLDGEPYNVDGYKWVEINEYDKTVQGWRTFYYFWMKNKQTIPTIPGRRLSVYNISQMITNPSAAGIPWFSLTNNNTILLGSLKDYNINENTILQINWKTDTNDGNIHRQWVIAREGDSSELIDDILWSKMSASLVGWDTNEPLALQIPDQRLSVVEQCGNLIRPRQSWFKPSNGLASRNARRIFVDSFNHFVSSYEKPFVDEYSDFVNSLMVSTPSPEERTKSIISYNVNYTQNIPLSLIEDTQGILYRIKVEVVDPFVEGNPTFTVGTDDDHSRFISANDVNLRTTGVSEFTVQHNIDTKSTIKLWMNWPNSIAGNLNITITMITANLNGWDYSVTPSDGVTGREMRDLLQFNPGIHNGDRVLITSDVDLDGFWTLWTWNDGWVMENNQTYRISYDTNDFITYDNWYSSKLVANSNPLYYYDDYTTMIDNSSKWINGSVVQVNDDVGRWSWYQRDISENTGWILVGREHGSIKLSSQFYESSTIFAPAWSEPSSWNLSYDAVTSRDGSRELEMLLKLIREQLTSTLIMMQNQLFFALVKFVHSEQKTVDWVFKTSFIYISGLKEVLTQNPIQVPDNTESIIDYINEVKPYHTKIRDFIRSMTVEIENANIFISDFDKPATWDSNIPGVRSIGNWRVANESDEDAATANAIGPYDETTQYGMAELTKWRPWSEWWALYAQVMNATTDAERQNAINQYVSLVRTMEITIKFDRVESALDEIFKKETLSDDDVARIVSSGAVARMWNSYPDLKENWKFYKTLIAGADFRGVVVDGGQTIHDDIIDFEHNAWDRRPWNIQPWDETQYSNVYPTTKLKKVDFSYSSLGDLVVLNGVQYYRKPVFEAFVGFITKYILVIVDDFSASTSQLQQVWIGIDNSINQIMNAQDLTFSGSWMSECFVEYTEPTDIYVYTNVDNLVSGNAFVVLHAADAVEKITYVSEYSAEQLNNGSENIIKQFTGTISEVKITVTQPFNNTSNIQFSVGEPTEHDLILKSDSLVFTGEQLFSVNHKQRNPVNINAYFNFDGATTGALRVEIKTEYAQQMLNKAGPLDPYYDAGITGGEFVSGYDPQTDDNPNILIEGGRFVQPFIEQDHPEERVDIVGGDVVSMTIHTSGRTGAPNITTQRFSGRDIAGPYALFNKGQSISSVFVFKNGIKLQIDDEYWIDWTNQQLWFGTVENPQPIALNDDILVNIMSAGGAAILEQKSYVAPTIYKFSESIIANSAWSSTGIIKDAVVVTVNGYIVDDFDVLATESSVINISPEPAFGDIVNITLYDSVVYSIVHVQEEIISTTTLPYTIDIAHGTNSSIPEHAAVLVYKNGERLSPPDTDYFDGNGQNNRFVINRPIDLNNISVMVNDVQISSFEIHPAISNHFTMIAKIITTDYNDGIDISNISLPPDTLWNTPNTIPEQAMWVTLNGVFVKYYINDNGIIRIKSANQQPIIGDIVEVRVYDWWVNANISYDSIVEPIQLPNMTYCDVMNVAVQSDSQVNVFYDNIQHMNYTMISIANGIRIILEDYTSDIDVRVVIIQANTENNKVTVVLNDTPNNGDIIEISTYENYDYTIVGSELNIITANNIGDVLEIITFTENESLGIRTEVFEGTDDGRYILSQNPYIDDAVWAAVDTIHHNDPSNITKGISQYPTKDYRIVHRTVQNEYGEIQNITIVDFGVSHARPYTTPIPWGADTGNNPVSSTPIEQYTWDTQGIEDMEYDKQQSDPVDSNDGMIYEPGWDSDAWDSVLEYERDRVWITTSSGENQIPSIAWRMFKTSQGYWETTRISDRYKTYLRKPLYVGSRIIELNSNPDIPVIDLPSDIIPQPSTTSPGVIWIGNERIEYRAVAQEMDGDRPYYILSNITRGTLGTTSGQKTHYSSQAIVGDSSTSKFVIDNNIIKNYENLMVSKYTYEIDYIENNITYYRISGTYVMNPNDYNIIRENGVWKISFKSPPANSVLASSSPYYPTYNPNITAWDYSISWDDVWDVSENICDADPIEPVIVDTYYPNVMLVGYNNENTNFNDTIQYNVGEVAVIGTHKLPGGYVWQPNPHGIQHWNTAASKYLLKEPGTWL
jgi:hypothetical protein